MDCALYLLQVTGILGKVCCVLFREPAMICKARVIERESKKHHTTAVLVRGACTLHYTKVVLHGYRWQWKHQWTLTALPRYASDRRPGCGVPPVARPAALLLKVGRGVPFDALRMPLIAQRAW